MITNSLIIPYTFDDKEIRLFQVRKLLVGEVKAINNRDLKVNHPFVWMGKTLSLCLEELEGNFIYQEYSQTKRVPKVLMKLPAANIVYILAASQVYNFSDVIEGIEFNCRYCQKNNIVSLSLNDIEVPPTALTSDSLLEVKLPDPYFFTAPDIDKLGMDPNEKWDLFTFRIPLYEDLLALEDYFSVSSSSDFAERLQFKILKEVKSSSTGRVMPPDIMGMEGPSIFQRLTPRSFREINKRVADWLPTTSLSRPVECKTCGRINEVEIDPSFFFLLV